MEVEVLPEMVPVSEVKEFATHDDPYLVMAKGIYDSLQPRLESRMKALQSETEAGLVTRIASELQRSFGGKIEALESRLAELEKMVEAGITQIARLLKSLPAPQVHLPEGAIRVEAIVPPPVPMTTSKKIVYGPSGRPEEVVEKTMVGAE